MLGCCSRAYSTASVHVCACVIVLSPLPPYSVRPLSALHPSVPVSAAKLLCKRADATGTNPTTEVDTRESLGCP